MNAPAFPRPLRLTDDDYERISRRGGFGDRRVELREGVLVEMDATYTLHSMTRRKLSQLMEAGLKGSGLPLEIGEEISIRFGNSFYPTPDIVIWDLQRMDGPILGPEAKLVVEVADESLADDLGEKKDLYAAAGLPEYWVCDVRAQAIHRFHDPAEGAYRARAIVRYGEPLESATLPGLRFLVEGLPVL